MVKDINSVYGATLVAMLFAKKESAPPIEPVSEDKPKNSIFVSDCCGSSFSDTEWEAGGVQCDKCLDRCNPVERVSEDKTVEKNQIHDASFCECECHTMGTGAEFRCKKCFPEDKTVDGEIPEKIDREKFGASCDAEDISNYGLYQWCWGLEKKINEIINHLSSNAKTK